MPLLEKEIDAHALRELCDKIRSVFDLQIFSLRITPSSYQLIFTHLDQLLDNDDTLQDRWRNLGSRSTSIPPDRLRERMTSLGGIMQTLAQRYSRSWHHRNGGHGSIWARRYRSCLLADDTALLCAIACLESPDQNTAEVWSTATLHSDRSTLPRLAPLPLRQAPDGHTMPADEALLSLIPPLRTDNQPLLDDFMDSIDERSLYAYRTALRKGWALGRPDSLIDCLSRIGRPSGRGRSRRMRDLDDELGLCGVWG